MNENNKDNMINDEELNEVTGGANITVDKTVETCRECRTAVRLIRGQHLKDGLCPICFNKKLAH